MENYKFISHTVYSEDPYIKEVCVLEFQLAYNNFQLPVNIAFVRVANSENSGLYWREASVGCMKNGKREYTKTFLLDSNRAWGEIKLYLDSKGWLAPLTEKGRHEPAGVYPGMNQPQSEPENIPF